MRFRLKERWRGFRKRSIYHKLATIFGFVALLYLALGIYTLTSISSAYVRSDDTFLVETPEQHRAVGFISVLGAMIVIAACPVVICWLSMAVFYIADVDERLKKIENTQERKERNASKL